MAERILVTGGTGFVASHCLLQALAAGYAVRTTVRSLSRENDVRATLEAAGAPPGDRLHVVAADLTHDAGWAEAVAGCAYVLHVASPFTPMVKDEMELIVPAREGALRVLSAARDVGVRRVVLTSSFGAIGYGHAPTERAFTEADWTDSDAPGVSAYVKSKALAERAAWAFIEREGRALELSVVNPVGIFGPVLGPDLSGSIQLVLRLLEGAMPGTPRLYFGAVDVRDVADLHLRAMLHPAARGQRFIGVAGELTSLPEIAQLLRARFGAEASRVPARVLPSWLLRLLGPFNPQVRQMVPDLDQRRRSTGEKARRVLGWTPRSNEEAIVATAESLLRLQLVKPA